MRHLLSSMIIGLSTVILAVGAQAQTFSLYDAFTGPLDPALWNGFEQNSNSAIISNTETQRAVVQADPQLSNRFLQLMMRTGHSGTGSDAGSAGDGRQNLRVARDDIESGDPSVIGMKTRAVVRAMTTPGCPTSADPVALENQTRSRAQVIGSYFNDGSSTGPSDSTGDILAAIELEQRSTDGKLIVASIARCLNAACSSSTRLKTQIFTRTWALNGGVPLTVVWDRAGDQFVYTAGTEVHTLTYGDLALTDTNPSVLLFYNLRISNIVSNCSTPIRAAGTARFDFLHLATERGVFFPMIDQQQPSIDTTEGGLGIGGASEQKLAQVVTQGVTGFVTEIRLPVACSVGDLVIELQGVGADQPNGVVLTSQTIPGATLPRFSPSSPSFRTLAFSAPSFCPRALASLLS